MEGFVTGGHEPRNAAIGRRKVAYPTHEGVQFNNGVGGGGNENENGIFQHPIAGGTGNQVWPVVGGNNNEGNYVLFQGLTGTSFSFDAWGSTNGGQLRAPVNGVQILYTAIPEPSTMTLVAFGLLALARRRQRR